MIVEFTATAEQDLRDIAEFIALDNLSRALSFTTEIEQACLDLTNHPQRFALVKDYEDMGIRRRVHGKYLIFYRVEDASIQILNILNGTQDYHSILFGEE